MRRAIQVVWWIGLIGALVATLAVLKEVALVLRALKDIHQLTERTRDAARGVAANLAATPRLAGLEEPTGRLREATQALAATAASIERKLDTLAAEPTPRGG